MHHIATLEKRQSRRAVASDMANIQVAEWAVGEQVLERAIAQLHHEYTVRPVGLRGKLPLDREVQMHQVRVLHSRLDVNLTRELGGLLWSRKQLHVDLLDRHGNSVCTDRAFILATNDLAKRPLTEPLRWERHETRGQNKQSAGQHAECVAGAKEHTALHCSAPSGRVVQVSVPEATQCGQRLTDVRNSSERNNSGGYGAP